MLKKFMLFLCLFMLTGCATHTVRPLDRSAVLKHICIKENPKVEVNDFLNVVIAGFERHGIRTSVYSGDLPNECEYVLTYTALRSWDLVTYLSHAELRIEKEGKQIAYAEFHLKGKGGLTFSKFSGTKSKMDPVIDELLKDY